MGKHFKSEDLITKFLRMFLLFPLKRGFFIKWPCDGCESFEGQEIGCAMNFLYFAGFYLLLPP